MSNAKGYILLHRKILNNPIWDSDEKFTLRSAWIDILLMVNHADADVPFNGQTIKCTRGSRITSLRKLSVKWGVSRRTVVKWLDFMQNHEMIQYSTHGNYTTVTVKNYDKYQLGGGFSHGKRTTECTTECTTERTTVDTTECTQTIKYIKNDTNNDTKKEICAEAHPTFAQWKEYQRQ